MGAEFIGVPIDTLAATRLLAAEQPAAARPIS